MQCVYATHIGAAATARLVLPTGARQQTARATEPNETFIASGAPLMAACVPGQGRVRLRPKRESPGPEEPALCSPDGEGSAAVDASARQ